MILTTYDRGRCEALRSMVIRLATRQCGEPDENTRTKIQQIEDIARSYDSTPVGTAIAYPTNCRALLGPSEKSRRKYPIKALRTVGRTRV